MIDPLADCAPKENDKNADEELCGSLDEWLQNLVPFGVELDVSSSPFFKAHMPFLVVSKNKSWSFVCHVLVYNKNILYILVKP